MKGRKSMQQTVYCIWPFIKRLSQQEPFRSAPSAFSPSVDLLQFFLLSFTTKERRGGADDNWWLYSTKSIRNRFLQCKVNWRHLLQMLNSIVQELKNGWGECKTTATRQLIIASQLHQNWTWWTSMLRLWFIGQQEKFQTSASKASAKWRTWAQVG
jgi:hypothetical protein